MSEEIASTFGRLPPAFLPFGSRRLFEAQVELGLGDPVAMTVPDDFEIPVLDRDRLDELQVRLLPQPQRLTLPEAIVDAIARLAPTAGLRILYGDTLVEMAAPDFARPDIVAVKSTPENFPWAYCAPGENGAPRFSDAPPERLTERRVVCGYFTFSDPKRFAQACQGGDLLSALNAYAADPGLTPVEPARWSDFGHLPLLFQSRRTALVARSFNTVSVEADFFIKRSNDAAKLRAERAWYEALPAQLRLHTPRLGAPVDDGAGYALEYLHQPLLADLFALGALPLASWLEIFRACKTLMNRMHALRPPAGTPEAASIYPRRFFSSVFVNKTWSRLDTFLSGRGLDRRARFTINGRTAAPISDLVERCVAAITPSTADHIRYWHGDLSFGNLFYDFNAQRALCIDPRGQLPDGGRVTYGDYRYDLAKLAHSVLGKYDKINLGRVRLHDEGPQRFSYAVEQGLQEGAVEAAFIALAENEYAVPRQELAAMTALLFLSMLPLHADDAARQSALLCAGLEQARIVEEGWL